MKVLLVDDEQRYRDSLRSVLERAGHDVLCAGSGREAIDRGVDALPDLLISDWMLCDDLHGLHVSEALQELSPSMRTILMTGYASDDLRTDAARLGVAQFLEKPFHLDQLEDAVTQCSRAPTPGVPTSDYGLVRLDADGRITHANPRARKLFARTRAGEGVDHLARLVGDDLSRFTEDAVRRWTRVAVDAEPALHWWVRCSDSNPRIATLHPDRETPPKADLAVQILLSIHEPVQISWDLEDRVLVLDRDSMVRDLYVSQLQRIGCICYKAEVPSLALDLLRADELIRVAVVDRDALAGMPLSTLIHQMQMIRSGLRIVGSSSNPREQKDFSSLGVHRFIDKPWHTGDLIDALRN